MTMEPGGSQFQQRYKNSGTNAYKMPTFLYTIVCVCHAILSKVMIVSVL